MTQKHLLTIWIASGNPNKVRELQACLALLEDSANARYPSLQLKSLPNDLAQSLEIDENGVDFLANALIKAQAYSGHLEEDGQNAWILAEDSGVVVPALDGYCGLSPFPGVRSKRWLTPALYQKIMETDLGNSDLNIDPAEPMPQVHVNAALQRLLLASADRRAAYHCGMVLLRLEAAEATPTVLTSTGILELTVSEGPPRGEHGFGYDPIMIPVDESFIGDSRTGDIRTMAELTLDEKNKISHRRRAFEGILNQLR